VAQRHIPERTCAACRTQRAKRELVRLVKTADQTVKVDPTGKQPGRGAYLCRDPRCWSTALKRNTLSGALKTELRAEDRDALLQFARALTSTHEALSMGGENP
jgi:predicted RNA-binding protein YlxR (DUF448 family)